MATLKLLVSNPNITATTLTRDFFKTSRHQELIKLFTYFIKLASGKAGGSGNSVSVSVTDNATAATGTVTAASASAADTVTVGNVVFTAVSGTPSGNQFKVGVTNTADGLSLATAINANVTLAPHFLAANLAGVVTITSLDTGTIGNMHQLSSSNNTRLAVVGFASGADATVKTYSF